MDRKEIVKELRLIQEQINGVELKLDRLIQAQAAHAQDEIDLAGGGILDLATVVDGINTRVTALEGSING